jgi:hypothetical protein
MAQIKRGQFSCHANAGSPRYALRFSGNGWTKFIHGQHHPVRAHRQWKAPPSLLPREGDYQGCQEATGKVVQDPCGIDPVDPMREDP